MKKIVPALVLFSPLSAIAHEGHDHSHWSSNIIHLGIALSTITAVALVAYLVKRHRANKQDKEM